MDIDDLLEILNNAKASLDRLRELLEMEFNSEIDEVIIRDAKVKRFEFCFGVFWKLMQKYLRSIELVDCYSPRSCFREAFKVGLINEEETERALEMARERNLIIHVYNEEVAQDFVEKLEGYYLLMRDVVNRIEDRIKKV